MVVFNPEWRGYGGTVQYRSQGASRAAKLGAVAVLVRSMTGHSLRTPHTGALNYAADVAKIPAAAITVEDAAHIERLTSNGVPVRVRLRMEAQTLPDAEGANVMAEITGREKPEEVVVLGGHFDSWDVGQGAHDDGAACLACWQAVRLMRTLGLRPRRTVRVVLWANEENGLRGGRAYREMLGAAVSNHVAAIEMDSGCERPVGYGLTIMNAPEEVTARAMGRLQQIGQLLESIGANQMTRGGGGADIGPLMREGVPGIGHKTVGERYMDWHHTHADTLDKVERADFQKSVAALSVLAYILSDMPDRLGA
jgi:Zn-dependent M28 family amino/carboxypeptidase